MEKFFSVSFDKSSVEAPRSFVDALTNAEADDRTTFRTFTEKADAVYRSRGKATVKPVLAPGGGVKVDLQRTFKDKLPVVKREKDVDILWQRLNSEIFFSIDRENRLLAINSMYRAAILGGRKGSRGDAPLVKILLLLLVNDIFKSERESSIARATLAAYQEIFVAAAKAEER